MPLVARAFAKINLFLDVTGKRPDGYHALDSVFQSVSLYDDVTLTLTENGIAVICDNDELSGENNIVYKACELFFEASEYSGGVKIEIKKNIPVAAGLGGGSADAAAVIYLLNIATGVSFSIDKLEEIALKLGADVPFCLTGGTARVKGIGEKIFPVPTTDMYYVLLKDREKQSTGKMFAKLDNTDYVCLSSIDEMLNGFAKQNLNKISSNFFNAFAFCWDFEKMTAPFVPFKPLNMFLSGSGPTVCALFENQVQAERCAEELKGKGLNAFYAKAENCGIELV